MRVRCRFAPAGFHILPLEQRNAFFADENKRILAKKRGDADGQFRAPAMSVESSRPAAGVNLVSAASINPEPIDWLWEGYLARGKLHILAGAPGTGKTTIAIRMAAIVSSGGKWPDGSRCPPGNVLIWSGEDGVADTLVPRLHAAGADVERCHFISSVRDESGARPFDPAKDFPDLQAAITRNGGASLLICDPVVSAVAADSHKNTEVRRGLQPLVDLAGEMNCALVGITHFSKGTGGRDPVERITGSIAFGAVARVVYAAAKEQAGPDGQPSDRRLFVRAKSNIGPDGGGFAYKLTFATLDDFPGIITSTVTFGEALAGEARNLLAAAEADNSGAGGALEEAKDFLLDLLAGGPVPAKEGKRAALDAGIAGKTLERAKKDLGAGSRKSAMDGGWEWNLSEDRQD